MALQRYQFVHDSKHLAAACLRVPLGAPEESQAQSAPPGANVGARVGCCATAGAHGGVVGEAAGARVRVLDPRVPEAAALVILPENAARRGTKKEQRAARASSVTPAVLLAAIEGGSERTVKEREQALEEQHRALALERERQEKERKRLHDMAATAIHTLLKEKEQESSSGKRSPCDRK